MSTEVRQDKTVQRAICDMFIGSVPERAEDLAALWKDNDLVIRLFPDVHEGGRIIMAGGTYRYIHYNHRVLRSFLIGAFAAWEGYRTVAESPNFPKTDLTRLQELLGAFDAVIQSEQSDAAPLPAGIPEPGHCLTEIATLRVAQCQSYALLRWLGLSCMRSGMFSTNAKARARAWIATRARRNTARSFRAMNLRPGLFLSRCSDILTRAVMILPLSAASARLRSISPFLR